MLSRQLTCFIWLLLLVPSTGRTAERPAEIEAALRRAGDNRAEIAKALDQAPADQRRGMRFLVTHMPERDLKSLSARFLLDDVQHAYDIWNETPWKDQVPEAIFLNNVLPYASINERRDPWRADFRKRFGPLVKEARTPAEAAAILNQKVFPLVKVRYSTGRPKADQSPYESIKSGTASCTGLSVLLIDACRSVGVPARFVGTPLWTNKSGNHSWVEVWDDGWHFTGAAEPTGNDLDQAWFAGRATTAQRDHPLHAIYAVSYRRTPIHFPLVWDRNIDFVRAVNVTDRYTRKAVKLPEGKVEVMFRVVAGKGGQRMAAKLTVKDSQDKVVFEGTSKDERFDANDHLIAILDDAQQYNVEIVAGDRTSTSSIRAAKQNEPHTFVLKPAAAPAPAEDSKTPAPDKKSSSAASAAISSLKAYLAQPRDQRGDLAEQPFAGTPLTKEMAKQAERLLWDDHVARIRSERAAEMKAREIRQGDLKMPFYYKVFGEKPANGRSLYFSLHGGGGAPPAVNDSQWENQKRLYKLEEGIYLVPRAQTNTWNLWHQGHIDGMFARLIENLVVLEDVDPERVYVMGYSAGGDGVYQLAPRMADRLAAAAMMAGHPNETSPLGLRNLPFTLHVGGRDAAYNRNQVAAQWKESLAKLAKEDPKGYPHWVEIHEGKGHWMDREDAKAIPWMAKYRRRTFPERIVWKQDDVFQPRFYWLAVQRDDVKGRAEVVAQRQGQTIDIERSEGATRLTVLLNDQMLDLDQPVTIRSGDRPLFEGVVKRTIGNLANTISQRGDPTSVFAAQVQVELE